MDKHQLIKALEGSSVSERLKGIAFSKLNTYCSTSVLAEDISAADVVVITDRVHIDQIKDVAAIKTRYPHKKCYILSMEMCRDYILAECNTYVDRVITFQGAFELGMLLSTAKEGIPVITRHRIPDLAFVTYTFPFRHIYKPYGFLYTTKLKGDWNAYLADDRGFTEAFMIKNSQAVYHLEGDDTNDIIYEKFGVKVMNVFPGCLPGFFSKPPKQRIFDDNECHIVYMSSVPHKYILPYAGVLGRQKIHLHVFLPYYYKDSTYVLYDEMKRGLALMLCESYDNNYFHLHPEYSYTELVQAISGYDFAFPFFDFPPDPVITPVATNFFAALEAGLPLIVPNTAIVMSKIVNEHGLGFSLGKNDIKFLEDKIRIADRTSMARNVVSSREKEMKYDADTLVRVIFG